MKSVREYLLLCTTLEKGHQLTIQVNQSTDSLKPHFLKKWKQGEKLW